MLNLQENSEGFTNIWWWGVVNGSWGVIKQWVRSGLKIAAGQTVIERREGVVSSFSDNKFLQRVHREKQGAVFYHMWSREWEDKKQVLKWIDFVGARRWAELLTVR